MRKKNKLVIVIIIVLALAVASAVFAYLFFETDIFKSKQELFFKYISQDIETLNQITDLRTFDVYNKLKAEDKYESDTELKTTHSEGGEVSNPLNNLSAKLNIQKDSQQQYLYIDGQILYENEECLETELIKEQDIYGLRFTDAVQQFISVKKDENTQLVSEDVGIDVKVFELIIDSINESGINISKEQINTLKDKYLNIITQELMKGTFQKQKEAMITYNNVTTETNAYSVSLTSEQAQNMILQILNNFKEEEIFDILQNIIDKEDIIEKINELINKRTEQISTLKITVYEQKQKAIRTVIEIGNNKIVMENSNLNTKINFSNLSDEEKIEYQVEINKQDTGIEENIEIKVNIIKGEENYSFDILSNMQKENDKISLKSEFNNKQGITTISLLIKNETEIGKNFEKAQSLSSENNIIISSLEQERRKSLINVLNTIVPPKLNERINLLKEKFGITENEEIQTNNEEASDENGISQIEVNKFNSKFEFYTGDEVSAENVNALLNVVQNNILSYEVVQENNSNDEEIVETIKLKIEKDSVNEEVMNKVREKIQSEKKYKVSIIYKDGNGMIDYITINEI